MTKKKDSKDKLKVGRPSAMTPEIINKLEQAFSMGASDAEACAYVDIATSIFYRYQDAHPEFRERKNQLKEKMVLKARSVILNALNEKDKDTAKWYLERKCKNEFSTKQVIENEPIVQKVFITKEDAEEVERYIDDVVSES